MFYLFKNGKSDVCCMDKLPLQNMIQVDDGDYAIKEYDKVVSPSDLTLDDNGNVKECVLRDDAILPTVKAAKLSELKAVRDAKEMEPVLYALHKFDFDSKSYERITAAIYALDLQGETSTINWTLADNGSAPVTANDLRGVIAAAAARSDALHTAYRGLKSQVQAAETVDDVNNITWPAEGEDSK